MVKPIAKRTFAIILDVISNLKKRRPSASNLLSFGNITKQKTPNAMEYMPEAIVISLNEEFNLKTYSKEKIDIEDRPPRIFKTPHTIISQVVRALCHFMGIPGLESGFG